MEKDGLISSSLKQQIPPTKTYKITPKGRQFRAQMTKMLGYGNISPSHDHQTDRSQEEEMDQSIEARHAQEISDILGDIFLDDSPSSIELQRLQTGTKKMIKYLQRNFHEE